MAEKLIVYLLATLLCVLNGCKTPTIPPLPENSIKQPSWWLIPPPPPPPPSFIRLNEEDYDPYPFVGSVNKSEDDSLIGSGVIINPILILTAAHVPYSYSSEDLVFITQDGDRHCIEEVIYYPKPIPYLFKFGIYNWSNHFDIAILVLEDECDEVPVPLFDDENDFIFKGTGVTVIGYSGGRKRYSTEGVFWYYGRFIKKPQFLIILPLKDTIWFGDSGGALITNDGKLIGITSYLSKTAGIVYENGFSSIEYYYDWINKIIEEKTKEECYLNLSK